MRKSTTFLAALVLSAGMAAPAFAAPALANPDGTTPGVKAVSYGFDASDTAPHVTRVALAVPDNREHLFQSPRWSCGVLRVDGEVPFSTRMHYGRWIVAVGASYDLPKDTSFVLDAAGPGWSVAPFDSFGHFGDPSNVAALSDLPAPADGSHPPYRWLAEQDSVEVTYQPAEGAHGSTVQIRLAKGLRAGEYFNLSVPLTLDPPGSWSESVTISNAVATNVVCETRAPVKRVNSGGVDSGTGGLAVIALGAAAVGGLALFGRGRSKR
ncbi:hypothetical protein [Granulicoccus sp. GXG6511]|uniref:hypothetical protein n=1 Tax=Granulicoccus sp. GXG6511 TaxID=3381351 RepID=UPI003D7D8DC2